MTVSPVFKHRPKLGDIIYSLPLIRSAGGGVLLLDPVSPYVPGDWDGRLLELAELLKSQYYLHEVKLYDQQQEYDYDLDVYMNTTHLTAHDTVSIVENHFIGAEKPFYAELDYTKWLEVEADPDMNYKVVVARSSRHQDSTIDYNDLLKDYLGDMCFVGTEDEYNSFSKVCRYKLPHYKTNSVTELAQAIEACKLFIGNQSLPLALATALRKPRFIEQCPLFPNCRLNTKEEIGL